MWIILSTLFMKNYGYYKKSTDNRVYVVLLYKDEIE